MPVTQSMVAAFGRHVVSYAAGGVTVGVGVAAIAYSMHGITADQAAALTDGFKQLGAGITSAAGGIATIASVAAALWASYSATQTAQIQSAAAVPGTVVVTTPSIAAATPELNIKSNVDNRVVPAVEPSLRASP